MARYRRQWLFRRRVRNAQIYYVKWSDTSSFTPTFTSQPWDASDLDILGSEYIGVQSGYNDLDMQSFLEAQMVMGDWPSRDIEQILEVSEAHADNTQICYGTVSTTAAASMPNHMLNI